MMYRRPRKPESPGHSDGLCNPPMRGQTNPTRQSAPSNPPRPEREDQNEQDRRSYNDDCQLSLP
jgi:hypothetical protein